MTPHPCAQDAVPPGEANGRRAASALAIATVQKSRSRSFSPPFLTSECAGLTSPPSGHGHL